MRHIDEIHADTVALVVHGGVMLISGKLAGGGNEQRIQSCKTRQMIFPGQPVVADNNMLLSRADV